MADMEKDDFKFPDEVEVNAKDTRDEKVEFEIEDDEAPVKLEVVDDTPAEDRGRKPMEDEPDEVTDEELSRYKDTRLRDRLSHLSKARHEERRQKESAMREREEAISIAQRILAENEQLKSSMGNNHKVILDQAKTVAAQEFAQAKAQFKAAYESGDSEALVMAQEAFTNAKLKADRIEAARQKSLQEQENVVQRQSQPPSPAREAPTVDEKAVRWKDRNSWFNKDREMTGFALAVHEKLVEEEGISPQSDAYYERIDARMREKFPEKFSSQPRRSNVVAPATRSTAPKKIVLKSSQVNLAKRLGIPLELYAKQVALEMRKERA
jgi:hypothetical protein